MATDQMQRCRDAEMQMQIHPEVGGRGHGINLWYQAAEVAKFSSAELQLIVGSTYVQNYNFIYLFDRTKNPYA